MSRISGIPSKLAICVGILLLLAAICPLTHAQNGFLSIDCGYTGAPYFDDLGLMWESDTSYIRTGMTTSVTFNTAAFDNSRTLKNFRYFPETPPRNKYCYDLPTTANTSSLIRISAFLGNSSGLVLPIVFDCSINGTIIEGFGFNIDESYINSPGVADGVFFSPGTLSHFCLLPVNGTPFISTIEIRALRADDSSLYSYRDSQEQYLLNFARLNLGSDDSVRICIDSDELTHLYEPPLIYGSYVRYPDDKFDRIWGPQMMLDGYQNLTSATAGAVSFISDNSVNSVPPRVMANAWQSNDPGFIIPINLYGFTSNNFYVAAYFEELNATMPIRVVITTVNGETKVINASTTPQIASFGNLPPVDDGTAMFSFSVTPESTIGPIVNAIEVYQQFDFDNATTNETDVAALDSLQTNLNLTDWQGDPCLPVPWNWVVCDDSINSSSRRVTKILLSNSNINGTFPSSLSQLDALTEIRLDNNSIFGEITPALSTLPNLTVLLLSNNKLTGEVPAELKAKTGLNFTYYNNDFSTPKSWAATIVGATAGVILFVLIVITILICYFKRWRKPSQRYRPAGADVTLKEVLTATDNYVRKVGMGSYGSVYHGNLDGKEVAVKVNGIHSDQRNQEFITEVDILTRVHHKNLVSLLGYCSEGQQLILLYEYQANGTLREWLYKSVDDSRTQLRGFLDWSQRLRIAVDAAKGLEYLHKNCVPPIIHRDVKSSNILLDEYLVGKVADFGVSKTTLRKVNPSFGVEEHSNYFDHDSGGYFTNVKGTLGYLDPEYVQTLILSPKCDVYSFGVVLAELISGQPAIRRGEDGNAISLITKLHGCVESGTLEVLADPNLEGDFDWESMVRVANIALACARLNGDERPNISEVVRSLELADSSIRDGLQDTIIMSTPPSSDVSSSYPSTGSETSTTSVLNPTSSAANSQSVHWGSVTTYD